jgi:hypothetical protein
MPPKAVLTCNFFAPLRTTDMDMETNVAGSQKTREAATNNNFNQKPHLTPRRLQRCQRSIQVPRYSRWNLYHNKRNGGLFSYEHGKNYLQYFTFSITPKSLSRQQVTHHLP